MKQTVWVIESSNEPDVYAAVSDGPAGAVVVWTADFNQSLQFARDEDAVCFANLMRMIDVEIEEHVVDVFVTQPQVYSEGRRDH